MKHPKDNLIKFIKKNIKIIISILGIIVIILLIVLLPDLLYHIRRAVKKIPLIQKIIFQGFSDKEYVQIMMGALINCVAISVSISAFYVAKAVSKTQIEKHKQEILISASNIFSNLLAL